MSGLVQVKIRIPLHFRQGLVGELLKYDGSHGSEMVYTICSVIWHEEAVPRQWREGLIVNLFKKRDREDPGNYRGITLLRLTIG